MLTEKADYRPTHFLKFRSSLFKGLRFPKAEPLVGFKGEALNIYFSLKADFVRLFIN